MSSRAYVYTSRTLPDGKGTGLAGRAEVAGDLPLSLLLLLSVDPRPARSALSKHGAVAARGDGVARLRELCVKAGLSAADLARWDAYWAEHPPAKWLVLEPGEIDQRPAKEICAEIAEVAAQVGTPKFAKAWRRAAADELATIAWKSALFVDFSAPEDDAPEVEEFAPAAVVPAAVAPATPPPPRSVLLNHLYHQHFKYHPNKTRAAEVEALVSGPPLPAPAEARLNIELNDWLCHRVFSAWLAIVPGCDALARDLVALRGDAWCGLVPALEDAARSARAAAAEDERAARPRWVAGLDGRARDRADDQAFVGWNTEPRDAVSAAMRAEDSAWRALHAWLDAQGGGRLTAVAHTRLAVRALVGAHATRGALAVDPAPLRGIRQALAALLDPTAQALESELYAWVCASARGST